MGRFSKTGEFIVVCVTNKVGQDCRVHFELHTELVNTVTGRSVKESNARRRQKLEYLKQIGLDAGRMRISND